VGQGCSYKPWCANERPYPADAMPIMPRIPLIQPGVVNARVQGAIVRIPLM